MKRIGLIDIHPFKLEWCSVPETDEFVLGDYVVVRDIEGEELGKIKYLADGNDAKIFIVRKATQDDIHLAEQLKQEAKSSFELFCKMLVDYENSECVRCLRGRKTLFCLRHNELSNNHTENFAENSSLKTKEFLDKIDSRLDFRISV